ncbi:MAG: TatD family hydrolase [Saccharofermentanales bacterium]
MLFDTHAHLNDERYDDDYVEVLARAVENGVGKILIASYDEQSSIRSLALAGSDAHLYSSIGIHPHSAVDLNNDVLDRFRNMIAENKGKIVAVGEIGLDYFRDLSPRDIQKAAFISQIDLAIECGLPFIIHDRDAHADCMEIIGSYSKSGKLPENPGIMHNYSGSYEMAQQLLKYGFYLSFGGPVTFKNARKALEFLPMLPLDRILVETDCPYLTPEPFRGKRNEPAYVRYVSDKIAQITGKSAQEIENATFENACRIFLINKT